MDEIICKRFQLHPAPKTPLHLHGRELYALDKVTKFENYLSWSILSKVAKAVVQMP